MVETAHAAQTASVTRTLMANHHKRRISPRRIFGSAVLVLVASFLALLQACVGNNEEAATEAEPPPPASVTEPESAPRPSAEAAFVDGRFLADAGEYPWSAIGRVNRAGRGFCNGVLIGAKLVLTQAQCLYTRREGRWWQPKELHFIAAYQRDRYLADSRIARFVTAPGYNPAVPASLANLTNNWAVVELVEPIGLQTGWLGLRADDADLKAAEAAGEAVFLRAGYRSDRPHALWAYIGCKGASQVAAGLCAPTPPERALPPLVMTGEEVRLLSDHFVRGAALDATLAELAATGRAGARLGTPALPQVNGPVRREASATAALLAEALGYPSPEGSGDIATLTQLISAAQRAPRPRATPPGG